MLSVDVFSKKVLDSLTEGVSMPDKLSDTGKLEELVVVKRQKYAKLTFYRFFGSIRKSLIRFFN